jgi:hypothetical protein
MKLMQIETVIGQHSGLSRKVLDYSLEMKRMIEAGKQPGFSEADWAGLAAMVATDRFERVGNFKEVMTWPEYVGFLTGWVRSSEWECSFKRVTQSGNVVFLELEERSRVGDQASVVNSVSVYEFDAAGKIGHLDIYLQMSMPDPALLQHYAGMEIVG